MHLAQLTSSLTKALVLYRVRPFYYPKQTTCCNRICTVRSKPASRSRTVHGTATLWVYIPLSSYNVSLKEAYLLLVLIYHFAKDWFQRPTGSASRRGVQHYDDSVALMIQLAQGKLALVSVLVDVKLVFSNSLVLLLGLQVFGFILYVLKSVNRASVFYYAAALQMVCACSNFFMADAQCNLLKATSLQQNEYSGAQHV